MSAPPFFEACAVRCRRRDLGMIGSVNPINIQQKCLCRFTPETFVFNESFASQIKPTSNAESAAKKRIIKN